MSDETNEQALKRDRYMRIDADMRYDPDAHNGEGFASVCVRTGHCTIEFSCTAEAREIANEIIDAAREADILNSTTGDKKSNA